MSNDALEFQGYSVITCDPGTDLFDADTGEVIGSVEEESLHFHRDTVFMTHDTFELVKEHTTPLATGASVQ